MSGPEPVLQESIGSRGAVADPAFGTAGALPRRWSRHLDWVIGLAVIGLFSWPLLFSDSGFSLDFTNTLWIGWVQSQAIAATHVPTLFTQSTGFGLFDPSYLYYGGAPFTMVGALSALVGGHFIVVFELFNVAVAAMTYGGSLWLARLGGVRGLATHAVPIAVVTAAYYATDFYGRGAWTEWVGYACVPLFAASIWSVNRSEHLRFGPVVAMIVSTVLFTGSHNVVLLWGVMIGLALALTYLALFGRAQLNLRRLGRTTALLGLGTALNAWFLFGDVFFGPSTGETQDGIGFYFFDSARALFDPLRFVPNQSGTPGLYVQLPIWFLAWSLLFGALTFGLLAHKNEARGQRRAWLVMLGTTGAVLALVMATPIWPHLPNILQALEFPYRLDGFLYLFIAATLIPVLKVLQQFADEHRRNRFRSNAYTGLAVASVVSLVLFGWQVLFSTRVLQYGALTNRSAALASLTTPPPTWYELANVFDDIGPPVVSVDPARQLYIPGTAVDPGGNTLLTVVNAPDGSAPIVTNLVGGPNVITIGGNLQRIGRTSGGFVVVRRVQDLSGPVYLRVTIANNWELTGGRYLSLIAGVAFLGILAYMPTDAALRRRRARLLEPADRASVHGGGVARSALPTEEPVTAT